MDPLLALRLNNEEGNEYFDAKFASKLGQTARSYIDAGLAALNFHVPDFDAATDLVEMFAPVQSATQFAKLDRTAAINFRDPLTFTEMMSLTSAVAQTLFGGEQARSVDATKDEDEEAADAMNGLLAWNDNKNSIFMQGFLWCWNAVVYNRGVWYESTGHDCKTDYETITEDDFTKPKVPDPSGGTDADGNPAMIYQTRERTRKKRIYSGYWNRLDLVSPYDFVCDPSLPVTRMNEWRYAGHRVMIPWNELHRRSKLKPSDDDYVLPKVVSKLKGQKGSTSAPSTLSMQASGPNTSRTFYERQLVGATTGGIGTTIGGGLVAGTDSVNQDDGGTIECFVMHIRSAPKTLLMYEDDEDEIIRVLISNQNDVLSVNILPNRHDDFPYCVGEGALNGHRQFSSGWALKVKPCQDRVDDLNTTHATAQKRMGNIIVIDATKIEAENILTPDKNGLLLLVKEAGQGTPIDQMVKQIPLTDVTATYPEESEMWKNKADTLTGAHAFVQGETEDPSQTLGQFNATKQMAFGRISSVARILSESALVPQTRRFVMNLQQFMPEQIVVRILGDKSALDPEGQQNKFQLIQKADIQCEFNIKPHDGSLPGTDANMVAAASRVLEVFSQNPMLAEAFNKTVAGGMDLTQIFKAMLQKSGFPVGEFTISAEKAAQNVQSIQQGMSGQPPPPGAPPDDGTAGPTPANIIPGPIGGMPGAAAIPPTPPATPPRAHPATS